MSEGTVPAQPGGPGGTTRQWRKGLRWAVGSYCGTFNPVTKKTTTYKCLVEHVSGPDTAPPNDVYWEIYSIN
ncbi:hypothetical protein GLOTRDRAFT_132271 [Gloeophyllum trabeum ATCC 11539]|uniref:Uncharacterized protein n=1 Tax=Gloeophyllum trabeum (strain ATCC 11539 / FP-39264 / Madison 617) TaxID=670483 RepID=S7PXC0_GLOTA|nr:uncharacterized protein GLOTRDRAFT_132271 [Gloeophyllum trabeum ATCC 11539]EPQ52153.1 hypothetical protein GLOTRDRAFT_132271 [Gloeophyllum trabeum ATCC 11539]